jgi:hypothetical protein
MRLEFGNRKYLENSYPQNHPEIIIYVDNQQELRDLAKVIDYLFDPIEKSGNFSYQYQAKDFNRQLYLYIGDQNQREIVDAVQESKRQLLNFIREYNREKPELTGWAIFMTILLAIFTFILIGIFKIIIILWQWSDRKLKEKFGLAQVQSSLILSAITVVLVASSIFTADATGILQEFQSYSSGSNRSQLPRREQPAPTSQRMNPPSAPTQPSAAATEKFQHNFTFPQNSCGDQLPDDQTAYPVTFYPVFVTYTDANLNQLKSEFCRDAFKMFREKNNRYEIQVGSFITPQRASEFKSVLSETFNGVDVGEGSIIPEKR